MLALAANPYVTSAAAVVCSVIDHHDLFSTSPHFSRRALRLNLQAGRQEGFRSPGDPEHAGNRRCRVRALQRRRCSKSELQTGRCDDWLMVSLRDKAYMMSRMLRCAPQG